MIKHKIIGVSDENVIALCIIMSIAIFLLDSSISLGVAGGVPYVVVVLVSLWSPRRRLPYYVAIGAALLTILGFYSSPPGGELWKVIFNRSLALFAIGITAILGVQRKNLQIEKEKALDAIKGLEGLIPICMYCHCIRDDEGAWNKLEAYISSHSEAEFSHGVCPKCEPKFHASLGLNNHDE